MVDDNFVIYFIFWPHFAIIFRNDGFSQVVQGKEQRIVLYCPPISWTSRMAGLLRNFSIRRCCGKNPAGVDNRRYGISSMLFHCFCHLF